MFLAYEAFDRGQAAASAGDTEAACRWLDRACRLAPKDQTLSLALATACLGHDDPRAAELFATLTAANDVREAWLGLATVRRRLGDAAGAAAALGELLSRHVPDVGFAPLADGIALAAGAPGWCGLFGDGTLIVQPGLPNVRVEPSRCHGSGASLRRRTLVTPAEAGAQESGRGATSVTRRVHSGQVLDARPREHDEVFPRRRLSQGWKRADWLTVTTEDGRQLLGSPIDVRAITRTVGCVACRDGGLEGWAWHPGDPDTDPVLAIGSAKGRRQLTVMASDRSVQVESVGLLARPRGFHVPAEALAGLRGALYVRGLDGRDLLGSPLDPGEEQRSTVAAAVALAQLYPPNSQRDRRSSGSAGPGRTAQAAPPALPVATVGPRPPIGAAVRRSRAIDVVVPVYGAAQQTLACLDSVLANLERPNRLLVVDDASPEPELVRALDELARRKRIRLIRHARNVGFAGSANSGLAATAGRDVVLLNSDTLVAPGWLEGLRAAAYSAPEIGTATPLSNDATIVSYPGYSGENAFPDLKETRRLAALSRQANEGTVIEIPVAVGFCMFIRRDCLDAVGLFRADLFAQGYGEENDFCLRARHLGWRHVAAPGVFVAHVGGHSFGGAAAHLRARNAALLERLHPGHMALIDAFGKAEPLAEAKRRFDLARWRAARRRGSEATVLVTHSDGGGVERQIGASIARHQAAGRRVIVLRPARLPDGGKGVRICDGAGDAYPNLRFAMPAELPAVQRLLAAERPREMELHHLMGHHPAVLGLVGRLDARLREHDDGGGRVPYDVYVHDYGWLCGRVALVGPEARYCGEPETIRCEECVADAGNLIGEDISVAALRARSAGLFAAARHVYTPSEDTAARIHRHFPAIRPVVAPHEDDLAIAEPPRTAAMEGRCRVCVIGAIGVHKGYQVVLSCARNAAERNLPLEFVVVGHTIDDSRLLNTGRVFVTGGFAAEEAVKLIKAQRATLALLPSIFPETWCLSLAEAWQAGLRVAAFDIGAPAERIRRTGWGFVLPLGVPPAAINNALVAAAGLSRRG